MFHFGKRRNLLWNSLTKRHSGQAAFYDRMIQSRRLLGSFSFVVGERRICWLALAALFNASFSASHFMFTVHYARLYSLNNLLLKFLSVPQIAFALNVEPKTRRLPKIPGKAQRGIQSDCALAVNNFVDATRRYVQSAGKRILRQAHRFHVIFPQNFSRGDVF